MVDQFVSPLRCTGALRAHKGLFKCVCPLKQRQTLCFHWSAGVENSANLCDSNRIVVHGERFARAVVPFSAKPFNFQVEYRLTEDQVTRRVSDWSGVYVLNLQIIS